MLGETIRRLRQAKGWKQQTLAARAGISQNYLSDIEMGKRTGTLEVLEGLAQALEAPLGDLMQEAGLESRPTLAEDALPPPLRAIFNRAGQYLDDGAWLRLVGYAEALAEERRRMVGLAEPEAPAYGYHVPEADHDAQEPGDDTGTKAS